MNVWSAPCTTDSPMPGIFAILTCRKSHHALDLVEARVVSGEHQEGRRPARGEALERAVHL